MPRFLFDIYDGVRLTRDDEGSELPDREAARKEALSVLPDIARDRSPDGDRRDFIVDVRDETGRVIYTATLSLVGRWID
jgi:hypothetical protein